MLSELDVSLHNATALDDINGPFCGKSYCANTAVQNVTPLMKPVSCHAARQYSPLAVSGWQALVRPLLILRLSSVCATKRHGSVLCMV